ncbi:unnamed protein product [Soboliphyme baturini]|uniref:Transposase n=1 Tax=Soboliphyme baturini TaxID=241478 RepID=A0A183J2D3_9BILA|nr:unnamed protein product [Soboliphyme baturini]
MEFVVHCHRRIQIVVPPANSVDSLMQRLLVESFITDM